MRKDKVIKELFALQDTREKIKIINNNGLSIKGFDNINYNTLEKSEDIIVNRINTASNINKIDKNIRQHNKHNESEFDYLLSPEKIIEKHNHNFEKLLLIFNNDGYGDLTESILLKLNKKNKDDEDEVVEYKKDNIDDLRDIIRDLEKKIELKDIKIKNLNKKNSDQSKEINNYQNIINKNEMSIKKIKGKHDYYNEIISEKDNTIEGLKKKITELEEKQKSMLIEFNDFKRENHRRKNIIGIPNIWKEENETELKYYNKNEIKDFIDDYRENSKEEFYVYKQGLTAYDYRKIVQSMEIINIKNKEEFLKI
ncbi:hypothetical protein [Mammaliicoccus lentus]|uniref:hypothetical protein n=1 Tax=Mammaliicoccus lentus TaxID=42858 RepID=UPI00374F5417